MAQPADLSQLVDLDLIRAVVEEATDAFLVTEADMLDPPGPRIVYVNPAFERLTGYCASEILGKTPRIMQGPLSNWPALDRMKTALRGGERIRIETVNYRKDRSWYDAELSVYPIRGADGSPTHWVALTRNVSARLEAERIRNSEHQALELMAKGASLGEVLGRLASGVESGVVGRWCVIHEISDEGRLRLIGADQAPEELLTAVSQLRVTTGCCPIECALRTQDAATSGDLGDMKKVRFRDHTGEVQQLGSSWCYPVLDSHGGVIAVFSVLDIKAGTPTTEEESTFHAAAHLSGLAIERIRAEEEQHRLERQLQLVTNNVPALISYMSPDLRYRFVNEPYARFHGRALHEFLGKHVADVLGERVFHLIKPKLELAVSGREVRFDHEFTLEDGVQRLFSAAYVPQRRDDGSVEGIIALILDVTEQRATETELKQYREHLESVITERTRQLEQTHERLREADRLASIGTLAAGLGHDLANILLPMRCRIDVLEEAGVPEPLEEELVALRGSIDYLARLSRGLKMCSMDPESNRDNVGCTDLATWWSEVGSLIEGTVAEPICFACEIIAELPPVAIAPHQLTQAVLNLVVNATEAISREGKITIGAQVADDGHDVALFVRDTGCGMTDEVRRQAMDPFFTTKKRGRSTGLGLSLVHSVAQSVHGTVKIDSSPGHGAIVTLTIPTVLHDKITTLPTLLDHSPVALVTVDDPRRQALFTQLLKAAGCTVELDTESNGKADLWIVDGNCNHLNDVREFLASNPARRVLLIGQVPGMLESEPGVLCASESCNLEGIRQALHRAIVGERSNRS